MPAPGLHYSPPGPPRGRTKNHGFFDTLENRPWSSINRPRAPPGPPRGAQGSIFRSFWMPFDLHFHDFSLLFLKISEKWKSCSCVHRDTKIKGFASPNPSFSSSFVHTFSEPTPQSTLGLQNRGPCAQKKPLSPQTLILGPPCGPAGVPNGTKIRHNFEKCLKN